MSVLVIGADEITPIKAVLHDLGAEKIEHWDARNSEFWLQCVDHALGYADEFKKLEKKVNF